MNGWSARAKSSKGQGIVEFALVLPLLVFVFMGMMEMGRVFHGYLVVTQAAREGARRAAVQATYDQIVDACDNTAVSLEDGSVITVAVTPTALPRTSGDNVTVSVTLPIRLRVPLIADIVGDVVTVEGIAVMRVE